MFTVPAENGPVLNLTRSSGVAERYPRWSPDGKTLAYWSDRSGEYELTLRPADGTAPKRRSPRSGRASATPTWSPDSTRVAFIDQAMRLRVVDIATKAVTEVDQSPTRGWRTATLETCRSLVRRFALAGLVAAGDAPPGASSSTTRRRRRSTRSRRATSTTAARRSIRTASTCSSCRTARSSRSTATSTTRGPTRIASVLRRRAAADGRRVAAAAATTSRRTRRRKDGKKAEKKDEAARKTRSDEAKGDDGKKDDESKDTKTRRRSTIDFDGLEARAVVLPPQGRQLRRPRRHGRQAALPALPRTGSASEKAALVYFDLDEREEKTVLDDVGRASTRRPTARSSSSAQTRSSRIVEAKAAQKIEKALRTGEMEAAVDPRAEWQQMFDDAYRFERDFFYDPGMHGVDWAALREALPEADRRLGHALGRQLRPRRVHRRAELVAHLSRRRRPRDGAVARRRHARRRLGASRTAPTASRTSCAAAPGTRDARSPLASPASASRRATTSSPSTACRSTPTKDPWASFQGLANKTVLLTVNGKPSLDRRAAGRGEEARRRVELRFREWIEQRRANVDKATSGRVGYIYVQSTGVDAQNELMRQFMAQWTQGRADHRRALQQRRADSGSVHRAAEPADAQLLGRARRRGLAVAAGRASRAEGDADQRLERIGRRRLPVLLPRGEARPADRHAHVGRPDRHQRLARSGRRRRLHGADVPDVRPAATGSPKATASSPTSRSTRIRPSWPRGSTRSWSARFRKCSSGWRSCRLRRRGRRRRSDRPLRGKALRAGPLRGWTAGAKAPARPSASGALPEGPCRGSSPGLLQRLPKVLNQVLVVLEPRGDAQQVLGRLRERAFDGRAMLDERLGAAEARRARQQFQTVREERERRGARAPHADATASRPRRSSGARRPRGRDLTPGPGSTRARWRGACERKLRDGRLAFATCPRMR